MKWGILRRMRRLLGSLLICGWMATLSAQRPPDTIALINASVVNVRTGTIAAKSTVIIRGTNDDELVEVTPKNLRLRKRVLAANMRPKRREDE